MYVLNTKREKENKVNIYKKRSGYIYTNISILNTSKNNNNLKFYLLLLLYNINQIYYHINL